MSKLQKALDEYSAIERGTPQRATPRYKSKWKAVFCAMLVLLYAIRTVEYADLWAKCGGLPVLDQLAILGPLLGYGMCFGIFLVWFCREMKRL
ncbi:hypothetical protein LJC46_02220 [Desulfovibrio sp. OttesenSCG-928-G15]|nr:hypothetical protein [Desulfovibrio sp. OttesenSCG-928-G15]